MKYVYILRSLSHPDQIYVGVAGDLIERLKKHNTSNCKYTARFVPWEIAYSERVENKNAFARERQIKSWSRAKKEALIKNDITLLKKLSKRKK